MKGAAACGSGSVVCACLWYTSLCVCVRVVHVGSFHVYVPCVYLSVYMECGGCVCMQRSQNRGVAGISVP